VKPMACAYSHDFPLLSVIFGAHNVFMLIASPASR